MFWKCFLIFLALLASEVRAEFLPQNFTSKFEQEYISTLKGKTKRGTGVIEYKYPGQIRFETDTPSTVIFATNGIKAWYYRGPFIEGEQGEVTESSAKEGASVYIKFFDILKNGLSSNSFYDVKKASSITLTFKQKVSKDFGIKQSVLYFSDSSKPSFDKIEAIDLVFNDGKKSKLKFVELKINTNIPSERFNFTAPPNTKKTN